MQGSTKRLPSCWLSTMMTSLAKWTMIMSQKSVKTCKHTLKKQHCLSSPFFGKKGIWLYQLTATLQLWSLAWERRKEGKNDNLDATRYPSKTQLDLRLNGEWRREARFDGKLLLYVHRPVPPRLLMLYGGSGFKKHLLLREIEFVFGLRVSFLFGEFFHFHFLRRFIILPFLHFEALCYRTFSVLLAKFKGYKIRR